MLQAGAHLVPVLSVLGLAVVVWFVSLFLPTWLKTSATRAFPFPDTTAGELSKAAALEASFPAVTKEIDFPSDWWTSPKQYQLETRAIFSKTWLHVCHTSLFGKPGDYRTFSVANFSFIVVLGKDGHLRAFHNVCRHRAYTVATKAAGSSLVMTCRYHGWSYNTKGKLIKAPKFEEVQGFDKSQNGLFEVRTFVDSSGFVYVNFDAYGSDGLTIRVGVPIRARLSLVDSWTIEGNFNWKLGVTTGAFHIKSLANLSKLAELLSDASGLFESWKWPPEFELSPLTRLMRSTSGDQWLTVTVNPISESRSSIHCSFYTSHVDRTHPPSSSLVKQEVEESIKLLEEMFVELGKYSEIKDTQSQEPLLAEVRAHARFERLMGKEIFPASRMRETSQACKVADDLCRKLEDDAGEKPGIGGMDGLAW